MNVPEREKKGESALDRVALDVFARPRWGALAGSVLAGVVVGAWLWSGGQGNSLADDALSHFEDEDEDEDEDEAAARVAGTAVPAEEVSRVLERGGIRLRPAAGTITHAATCRFRGREVPHLVVRTAAGPVEVLVLRDEPVGVPADFTGRGFSGRIEPAGPGSLVLVAATGTSLAQVAAGIAATIEWL